MIVSSFGALQTYETATGVATLSVPPGGGTTAVPGVWVAGADHYAAFYRSQPAVRTCVDFLARNMAQLGLHAFRRISDTDRERLADYQLIQWVTHPNPGTSRYKLFEALMQDLGIYWRAYWLKVRRSDGQLGLVRLPPASIQIDGWLMPNLFLWTLPNGEVVTLDPAQVVYFSGYDPEDLDPLSPLETLNSLLAEERAVTLYRQRYWLNAARLEGVVERPGSAPKWTKEQKDSWREQWQARYADKPGQVAVLEDGMTWKSVTQSWADSEYTASRKLTREEVAAAYHIPAPMVGILDHATFSNITEQHKNLYQDTLGPWCTFLVEELERQLLPECRDTDRVYLEFNISEKLRGSFEEQAISLQRLVGRPIMTANEGRARLNLPAIQDDETADALVLPLNQQTSGAGGAVQAPTNPAIPPSAAADPQLAPVLEATWARQWQRLEKLPADLRVHCFDISRWDKELAADLQSIYPEAEATALAERINTETLRRLVDGAPNPFVHRGELHGEPFLRA